MTTIDAILGKMPNVSKPLNKFLSEVFNIMFCITGKYNFSNLSRFSSYCDRTFRRWYSATFDFVLFNFLLISQLPKGKFIAAIDTSVFGKSGKKTFGKGKFWSTIQNRPIQGIEISSISLIHLGLKQSFNLSIKQTNGKVSDEDSRIDQYISQLSSVIGWFMRLAVHYIVADGFYAKQKFVSAVRQHGLHIISRLRNDANLRWLYQGEHIKRKGRKQKYSGKVAFNQLQLFRFVTDYDDYKLYEAVVYSISLKQTIKVVMIRSIKKPKQYALLFSTQTKLPALYVVQYYEARFQIEFLFRDAKQHTGLSDCQSTKKQRLSFHFNLSMSALNFAKLSILEQNNFNTDTIISIDNFKRLKSNEHWLNRIICKLDLDPDLIKIHSNFKELLLYGSLAA
jgi:hypothetical protein